MRVAFVLQLGSETETTERQLEGQIEEVETGRELRFRSTDELVDFLCQCCERARERKRSPYDPEDSP